MTVPPVTLGDVTSNDPAIAPVLELVGVSAGYGRTAVLRDVSVTVPKGSVVALLGPTGQVRPRCSARPPGCCVP